MTLTRLLIVLPKVFYLTRESGHLLSNKQPRGWKSFPPTAVWLSLEHHADLQEHILPNPSPLQTKAHSELRKKEIANREKIKTNVTGNRSRMVTPRRNRSLVPMTVSKKTRAIFIRDRYNEMFLWLALTSPKKTPRFTVTLLRHRSPQFSIKLRSSKSQGKISDRTTLRYGSWLRGNEMMSFQSRRQSEALNGMVGVRAISQDRHARSSPESG